MRARLWDAILAGAREFLRAGWRAARQVFHETTGALFVLFAAVGAAAAWREWHKGSAPWLIALATGFALMMAAFAGASFRNARRVR